MGIYGHKFDSLLESNANFSDLENNSNIKISSSVKSFISKYGGKGNKYIELNNEEYEIRKFLSLDKNDPYSIFKSIDWYIKKYNKKVIPIAVDSGDNYYVVDISSGDIYFSSHEDDTLRKLCSLSQFKKAIDKVS